MAATLGDYDYFIVLARPNVRQENLGILLQPLNWGEKDFEVLYQKEETDVSCYSAGKELSEDQMFELVDNIMAAWS